MAEFDLFNNQDTGDVSYIKGEHARNLVKWLFSDLKMSKDMVSPQVLKAILVKKNYRYLGDIANVIQEALNNLAKDPNDHMLDCPTPDGSTEYLNQKEIVIGNLLSIYALLCEPANNDELTVPVKIEGQWEQVKYHVHRIQLTPAALSEPYFAYGLVPSNKKADAKLLFGGTNPLPTATGSRMTKFMDMFPGLSVGRFAYNLGKRNIQHWVKQQYSNSGNTVKVTATGVSLGGSLSLLAHIEQPKMVNARAYAPLGLLANEAKRYAKRKKEAGITTTVDPNAVKIYTQADDFVFKVGTHFPENADIYEISANENAPTNKLSNHAKCYMGGSPVSAQKLNNDKVNNTFQRWFYTILWQAIAVPFFVWNVIYMGLKALTYPLNLLFKKLRGEVTADKKNVNIKLSVGERVIGVLLSVIAAVIATPVVVADLVITAALATVALVAFGLYSGVSYIGNMFLNRVLPSRNKNATQAAPQGSNTFFDPKTSTTTGTSDIYQPPGVDISPQNGKK